jgi:hypothetical protein
VAVTVCPITDAWTIQSVGLDDEQESDWLAVRAGTGAGGVVLHPNNGDGVLVAGGSYNFPATIVRNAVILGADSSAIPDTDVGSDFDLTFTVNSRALSNMPFDLRVYALGATPAGSNDTALWIAGASLPTILGALTISAQPDVDSTVVVPCTNPAAFDAVLNPTGTTWLYVVTQDLASETYLAGGHGAIAFYDETGGGAAPTITVTHDAGGAAEPTGVDFGLALQRRRVRR